MKSTSDNIILEKPPLFFENYHASERVVVNQGGTSSGKTYTILDLLFMLGMQQSNQVITVIAETVPNLKKGAYRDAKTIWNSSSLYQAWYDKPNETGRIFTCINGSIIEFNSVTSEQDAKSGKRDYLFVNEANGVPFNIYWQLAERTYNKIFIDYNPTSRFWVHDELIGKPDVKLIISDHRHNPFLTAEDHQRIESYTGERFKVYSRGKTGKMEGLIYTNWQLADEMPLDYKKRWIGLDFGFTNDPTAIVDIRLSQGELWLDEIDYRTGLTNPDIAEILSENGIDRSVQIVADSSEPKSIAEIRNLSFTVEGANKGKDSILQGIDILRRYRMNVTRRSTGLRRELSAYEWKVDRLGKMLNEPIDEFNHALDAVRYVALNKLGISRKSRKPRVRTTNIM